MTEEITGIDIVQSQILLASGKSLEELGLMQELILPPTSFAMQCRVTTEGKFGFKCWFEQHPTETNAL